MHLLSRGQSGFSDRSRYERAYREQANVIAQAERRVRDAGCFGGGFFLFRREPDQACGTLLPRLREMQENLARLDQLRRQAGDDRNYRIRELRDMMRRADCDLPGRSIFEAAPDRRRQWEDDSFYSSRGTYRTLCVRTCDGYYFPISFSTVPNQFSVDARACQALCPGAQSELYYHANPGGGPESMTSIAGAPYSVLPTAFKYRESFDPDCSCQPPGGYSVATMQAASGVSAADPTAPAPRPRPTPGEDPETLSNRAGDFVPRALATEEQAPATGSIASGVDGKPVRIVGPVYWGAPEQDGIVIAPVPN